MKPQHHPFRQSIWRPFSLLWGNSFIQNLLRALSSICFFRHPALSLSRRSNKITTKTKIRYLIRTEVPGIKTKLYVQSWIPGRRAETPLYLAVEQRYLCKVAESQDSLESRYMERQLPLSLWWLCLWFPRFLISLSIVSDPLMRLSIQTLMSGMEHRQGAEKRWSFNKHFYEYLPPPEI